MSHNGRRIILIGLLLVAINVLFSVSPAFGAWLSGWGKRVKITTDNTDIDSALPNFPVLIYLSSASGRDSPKDDVTFVFDEVGSNSKKIAVTTSDGTTQCYVEIEKWDSVSEKAWLWVKVPSISSTADTDFYLYYDNSQADNTTYVGDATIADRNGARENVWDSNFKLVTHLIDEDTSTIIDSTSNDNDGTKEAAGQPAVTTAGKVADAQNFDGIDDYINLGSDASLDNVNGTISVWIKCDDASTVFQCFVGKDQAGTNDGDSHFGINPSDDPSYPNKARVYWQDGTQDLRIRSNAAISFATWIHFTAIWGSSGVKMYLDGVEQTDTNSDTTGFDNPTPDLILGDIRYNTGFRFDGIIDEVRISGTIRTAAWIKAEYESETDDLLDFGNEEQEPPTGWLSGWGKRVKITTDNTDIDSALSNFPVLIYLSSASGRDTPKDDVTFVFDEVGSNSKKIAVTTSDGTTECYVEIEKWDSVSEKAWLWVKIPSINSTADTDFYLYYDNTQADNTTYVGDSGSRTEVWDSNFKGVWHLKEDPSGTPPQMLDSTSLPNNGTSAGAMTTSDQVPGKVDGSLDFDGSNDLINLGNSTDFDVANITVSAWTNFDSTVSSSWPKLISKGSPEVFQIYWDSTAGTPNHVAEIIVGGSNYDVDGDSVRDTMRYYVLTYDGETLEFFINGVSQGTNTDPSGNLDTNTANLVIANRLTDTRYWKGIIDEVRVSDIDRDAAWVKASYESGRDDLLDFEGGGGPPTGWLSGWANRVKMTIDQNDIDNSVSNFPVLVYLSFASGRDTPKDDVTYVFDEVGSNSKKIAVTTSNGTTQCYVEVEEWDSVSEKAWLWVKAPSISSTADTDFYLYYDNTQDDNTTYVGDCSDGSTATHSVWDDGGSNYFKLVDHMRDKPDTSNTRDSTSNNNDGTKTSANNPVEVDGKLSKGQSADQAGAGDWIQVSHHSSIDFGAEDFTIQMWVKVLEADIGENRLLCKGKSSAPGVRYEVYAESAGDILHFIVDDNSTKTDSQWADLTNWADNTWHYLVFRRDYGNTLKIFCDGLEKGTIGDGTGGITNSYNLQIFRADPSESPQSEWLIGSLDEIRITKGFRNDAWIKASYESERDDLVDFEGTGVPALSVSISTDTYNFGTFFGSTITVSSANITVENDGNVTETYSIKCSSSSYWAVNSTPGNDEFTLQAAFHSSQPSNDDISWKADDILTESLQQCTTAAFSIDGSEHGKDVPPSEIRNIWFRLKTPLSTSTTTQQDITVTISAEWP